MKRTMFFAVAFWAISAGSAWPIDQIYTSTAPKPYYGKISGMTSTVINFEPQGKKGPNEIAANEVTRVILEDSPQGLLNAQEAIIKGNYEKAIEALEKETVEDKRAEVGQEITFCRASCATQLALRGGADPMEAGKQMFEFIKNNPTNFHYFKACELLGDIFVALGKFAEAQKYYTKLGEAPWPDYKIRAQVALGRSYLAQDNAAAASKAFDEAMNNAAPGELARRSANRRPHRQGPLHGAGRQDRSGPSRPERGHRPDGRKEPRNQRHGLQRPGHGPAKGGRDEESDSRIPARPPDLLLPTRPRRRGGRQPGETVHPEPRAEACQPDAQHPQRQVCQQSLDQRGEVAMGESLLAWLAHCLGTPFAAVFLFLSVALLALMAINILAVRRDSIVPPALIEALEVRLGEDRFQEACELVQADKSVLARVLGAGLPQLAAGDEKAAVAMEEFGSLESIQMHARLGHVWLIAQLAPLVGLLGTVNGLIAAFETTAHSGAATRPFDLAGGIGTALVATAVGLWIAVVAVAFHQIVLGRVNRLLAEAGILAGRFGERFAAARKP